MITTIVAFLVTLGLLILVHEWGHYRVARAFDVKVLRFSMGFGKRLLTWRRGETEFALSLLPLGGYVKMLDEREGPVDAPELPRAFNRKPLWQRALIVLAGPVANLVLAVVLYAASSWIGTDEPVPVLGSPVAGSVAARAGLQAGDTVQAVRAGAGDWRDIASMTELRELLIAAALHEQPVRFRVLARRGGGPREVVLNLPDAVKAADVDAALMQRLGLPAPFSEPVIGEVLADGPAAHAGLRPGDRVLSVAGQAVTDAAGLRNWIRAAGAGGHAEAADWVVERNGERLTLTVQPKVVEAEAPPTRDAATDKAAPATIGRVEAGIGAPVARVKVRYGPVEGLWRGAQHTWDVATLTLDMLGKMLVGQASLRNISGPLTIADVAGQTAQLGLSYYLGFLALVSVSLGVLNLLPLPLLDGGHLMYYLFEGATGRPVPPLWMERLQRGGLALMLALMSLAFYNDVARLLGLH